MSLWRVAWRSIQQRALASALTAFSMGLGVALVAAVLVIHGVIDQSFKRSAQGYDLVVGAKGSSLALVLGTVFHLNLNQPLDTIPYSYYERFTEGRLSGVVKAAVPVCMGHDYKGFPAIATTPEMFELTYRDNKEYTWLAGRNFDADAYNEAVIGTTAARLTGLKIGDTFRPMAGAVESGGHQDEVDFKIVGILDYTGTPNDRAIFMNIEGFFRCPSHQQGPSATLSVLRGATKDTDKKDKEQPKSEKGADEGKADKGDKASDHDHAAAEKADHDHADHEHGERKLSAILIRTREDQLLAAMDLPRAINEGTVAQAVHPTRVITEFLESIVGNVQLLLLIIAVLVVIVAGVGILVSIYNSMNDRRHEIAIMRALGASRLVVMGVILMESILLSLGGGVLGVVLGHGLIGVLGPTIADQTGVRVAMWDLQWVELILIPGLIVLATLVGYLPAAVAYRTDVAKSLAAGT